MNEFQTPQIQNTTHRDYPRTQLAPTDRIIGGLIAAILIALVLWVGTSTQQTIVEVAKLSVKVDLNLSFLDKRMEKVETELKTIQDKQNVKNGGN